MPLHDFEISTKSDKNAWDDFCEQFLTDIPEDETDPFEIQFSISASIQEYL